MPDALINYVKGNNMSKLNEEALWSLIEGLEWTEDHDYKRIAAVLNKFPQDTYDQLDNFVDSKIKKFRNKYDEWWLGTPGINCSDDSWSDLVAEVVGRGRKFYENITIDKLVEMADSCDYHENFLYSFNK